MIDPAVFRAMVANGATPEMLLAVVEAAAAVEEEKRAKKRAGNAERQARFRAKNAGQGSGDNASNALQAVTERDSVTPTPSPSPSSSPDPSNNPTHTPGNQPRARKGTRLPADWQPGPLGSEVEAIVAPWPPGTVDREMAKFRDFWAAKAGAGGVKSDWQATWRNWLRQADERIPKHANRQQQSPSQHGSRTGYGRTGDAARRFLQAGGHH